VVELLDKHKILEIKDTILSIPDISILNEAQTKQGLIVPFIAALGYNTSDITGTEFIPEFTCDFGIKQGEKVDYALCISGKPIILIEAKKLGARLVNEHASQLFRYYNASEARLGILTNGNDYWFFADGEKRNCMDAEPYMKLRISEIDKSELDKLEPYSKEDLDKLDILGNVQVQKFDTTVKEFVASLYSGNIDSSLLAYLKTKSGVTDLEDDKMQDILNSELNRVFNFQSNQVSSNKPELIKDAQSSIEPHKYYVYNTVSWTWHKPCGMQLKDTIFVINKFSEALYSLIKYVASVNGEQEVVNRFHGSRYRVTFISDADKHSGKPIKGTSLWLGSYLSAQDTQKFMSLIMSEFGIPDESLLIAFAS
jgi:predicted type IV restriction endonuclease